MSEGLGSHRSTNGTVPPAVAVVSPENTTYATDNVSLAFTVNKQASWLGYSLDGQEIVTVTGNTTLTGLTNGLHNVTVYAKDAFGKTGASKTVYFSIAELKPEPESFPTALVAATSGASVAVIGAVLAVYFKRRKR